MTCVSGAIIKMNFAQYKIDLELEIICLYEINQNGLWFINSGSKLYFHDNTIKVWH